MSALNPDRETQLGLIFKLGRDKRRVEADHGSSMRLMQEDVRRIETERARAQAVFFAAEMAAYQTPEGLHYGGLARIDDRHWVHTWTDLEPTSPAHGATFSLARMEVETEQITRTRDEQRARFAVGAVGMARGAGDESGAATYVLGDISICAEGASFAVYRDQVPVALRPDFESAKTLAELLIAEAAKPVR